MVPATRPLKGCGPGPGRADSVRQTGQKHDQHGLPGGGAVGFDLLEAARIESCGADEAPGEGHLESLRGPEADRP
jgi:hypothetical protein